jgi:hypothetical protein
VCWLSALTAFSICQQLTQPAFGPQLNLRAADPDVLPARDEKGGRPRNDENCANGTVTHGSNQAITIVRRLKRDHPAIAAALARGEYPSARAAAQGLRLVPG